MTGDTDTLAALQAAAAAPPATPNVTSAEPAPSAEVTAANEQSQVSIDRAVARHRAENEAMSRIPLSTLQQCGVTNGMSREEIIRRVIG
jgi:hypothetical protein